MSYGSIAGAIIVYCVIAAISSSAQSTSAQFSEQSIIFAVLKSARSGLINI